MRHCRTWRRVAAFALLLPLLAGSVYAADAPRPAPAFTLRTAKGSVCLDSLRGKVVLVDFWASWCVPCHQSFPWLSAMQAKYGPQGFAVVAVGLDKSLDAADGFLAGQKPTFTVAFDPAGHTAEAWKVQGMPSTYLVDRQGRIVHAHVGFVAGKTAEMEHWIEEACKP